MERTYWHKQSPGAALFPDLEWSRPETKTAAGKLLIIGGHAHGLSAPAAAYEESVQAGIGYAKVLLPDSLKKVVGHHLETAEFAASTPSGSFSRKALIELLDGGGWADGVLVAGELGRNSETAVALESFVSKYAGQLTLTRDSVDYFYHIADTLMRRERTLLVITMAQLQKISTAVKALRPITFSMDLLQLIDALHALTEEYPAYIVVKHLDTILVAAGGEVSTTKLESDIPIWRVRFAAHAATWWLQHPTKSFEAITTSVMAD